jgi:effector-binding domain-containing protein
MFTEPQIEERKAQHYAGIRTQVPVSMLPQTIPQLLDETIVWMAEHSIKQSGAPFIRYYVINMKEKLDIEIGWPVPYAFTGDDRVANGVLPAGRYATLIYTGIDNGIKGNAALLDWGAQQNLKWDSQATEAGDAFGARVEFFLTGPEHEPDRSKWKTEVAIRLADG